MANCNRQQLNITCGTDVMLHDRLIFEGETFDPNLSVGIAANLVSSLGKRTALDVQVVDDELLISVPWIDGTLPGCYGLEVTGSCNSKKWATYADSLIRYTKATVPGESEVTIESDSYDITQEVGYRYSDSPVKYATATIDGNVGEPSVDVYYRNRVIRFDFHNLKGRQGEKGDTVVLDDGQVYMLYNTTGENTNGAMTQHAVTKCVEDLTATIVLHEQSDVTIVPNKLHKWNIAVPTLDVTLASASASIVNEYMMEFTCPANAQTTLNITPSVRWVEEPDFKEGNTYMISIVNGLAVYAEWEAAAP